VSTGSAPRQGRHGAGEVPGERWRGPDLSPGDHVRALWSLRVSAAAAGGYSDASDQSRAEWLLSPGDEPFLTQSIQVHTVEIAPGGSNRGHGHQNEATFYILEGRGYEIHDGKRYDCEKDDFVVVHNDSVHRHFNADPNNKAVVLVMKAKSAYMYFGLIQQGHGGAVEDGERYGPPGWWARLWTAGVDQRKKVVTPSDTRWETTRDGRVRVLSSPERTDIRVFSTDVYQQEIPGGSRSGKHWHMADEVLYVMAGRGHSLHWDVEAEIGDGTWPAWPSSRAAGASAPGMCCTCLRTRCTST